MRFATVAAIGAVAAIVAVAAVDAIRGDREARRTEPFERTELSDRAEYARRLIAAGIAGTLLYTRADCRLAALSLPRLLPATPPRGYPTGCAFSLSPDGRRVARGDAIWESPRVYAVCRDGVTEVRRAPSGRRASAAEGCVPAWRPTNPPTLTVVDSGAVRDVPPGCSSRRACRTIAIGRNAFFEAAIRHPLIAPDARNFGGVDVVDVRWLSERLAAVVLRVYVTGTGPVGSVALVEDGELRVTWPGFDRLVGLEPSPTGRYAVVQPEFAIGADGRRISIPPAFLPVHAVAWSPDEEWLAVATRGRVAFVRVPDLVEFSSGGTRLETVWIPLAVRDLAWR